MVGYRLPQPECHGETYGRVLSNFTVYGMSEGGEETEPYRRGIATIQHVKRTPVAAVAQKMLGRDKLRVYGLRCGMACR